MFKVEKYAGRFGRDYVVFSKEEKKLVKDFILELYQEMKYPSQMKSNLSRVYWKRSYISGSELHIRINVNFTCDYKINYLLYPKFSYFYHVDAIDLAIPFDAILQFKRDKVLNSII